MIVLRPAAALHGPQTWRGRGGTMLTCKRGGRFRPGRSVRTRARGVEKVTPEPMSLHGDFPRNFAAVLSVGCGLRHDPYALTQPSHPPCSTKTAIGGCAMSCARSRRYSEEDALRLAFESGPGAVVLSVPVAS